MTSLASRYFILFIAAMVFFSCGKHRDTSATTGNSKVFTATINGTEWSANYCKATYNVQRHELQLYASDTTFGKYYLSVGISLDSVSPLKKYVLESNGDNVAEVFTGMEQYNTDHNLEDAGGFFTLSSFDTLKGTLSGSLQFLSYSGDRTKKLTFSADSLNNVPLEMDYSDYDGSLASCTVNGVKNTRWQSRNFFAKVTCFTYTNTGINKSLEVHIESIVGGYPNHRFLLFRIPLNNPAGTYTIYPDAAPYFYCGKMNITSGYWINNIDISYLANEGNITITQIDTAKKKMKADFNISYKDLTGSNETIKISDGHFELNSWED